MFQSFIALQLAKLNQPSANNTPYSSTPSPDEAPQQSVQEEHSTDHQLGSVNQPIDITDYDQPFSMCDSLPYYPAFKLASRQIKTILYLMTPIILLHPLVLSFWSA